MPSHALQWPEQMGRQGTGASRRGEPPASEIEQRNLDTMKMLQERWDKKVGEGGGGRRHGFAAVPDLQDIMVYIVVCHGS